MYGAYEKILNRSNTQDADHRDLNKIWAILQLVLAVERPLALREMAIALPLTEYQPLCEEFVGEIDTKEGIWNTIRDCCGLLVIRVDDRLYLCIKQ